MSTCAVPKCKNTYHNSKGKFRFFSFPRRNAEVTKQWVQLCDLPSGVDISKKRVCSEHFSRDTDFEDSHMKSPHVLKRTAVPTVKKRKALDNIFTEDSKKLCIVNNIVVDTMTIMKELQDLRNENQILKTKLASMKSKLEQYENLEQKLALRHREFAHVKVRKVLSTIFTPCQVRIVLGDAKRVVWKEEDIMTAMSLRALSFKAYEFVRSKLRIPLPELSVLLQQTQQLPLLPGILTSVFNIMQQEASTFVKSEDRLCVISFGKKNEKKNGLCERVEMVVVQGLLKNWQWPIYYEYDNQNMTASILMNLIEKLYNIGYTCVAIVSDLGTMNFTMKKDLDITTNDNTAVFDHPCDPNLKIAKFADTPNLLKLLRNHFLDNGFEDIEYIENHQNDPNFIKSWSILDPIPLHEMMKIKSNSCVELAVQLRPLLLEVEGPKRQAIRPAAQLFSNTVASTLEYCHHNRLINYHSEEDTRNTLHLAEFIRLVNDWFDIFNTSKQGSDNQYFTKTGYGIHLEQQNRVLDRIKAKISKLKVRQGLKKNTLKSSLPFQEGIVNNINTLKYLYEYLQKKYNIQYIRTLFLSQDVLENILRHIKGMDVESHFEYRLRWFILGKHANVEVKKNKNSQNNQRSDIMIEPSEDKTNEYEIVYPDLVSNEEFCNEMELDQEEFDEESAELIPPDEYGELESKIEIVDESIE